MNRRGMLALFTAGPAIAAGAPGPARATTIFRLGRGLVGHPIEVGEAADRAAGAIKVTVAPSVDLDPARAELAVMKANLAEILRMRRLCGIRDESILEDLVLIDGAGI